MFTEKRKLGNAGEDLAVEYLMAKGYVLLGRNVQLSHHEVDIVMRDGECLVFVEVKTRRNDWFADPMRSVDDEKLWNLMEAAKIYRHEHPECYRMGFRIDVVCIVGDVTGGSIGSGSASDFGKTSTNSSYRLEHYESPFRSRIQNGLPWRSHYRKLRRGHYGYYRIDRTATFRTDRTSLSSR